MIFLKSGVMLLRIGRIHVSGCFSKVSISVMATGLFRSSREAGPTVGHDLLNAPPPFLPTTSGAPSRSRGILKNLAESIPVRRSDVREGLRFVQGLR